MSFQGLSELAAELHHRMSINVQHTQDELALMIDINGTQELLKHVQELINHDLIKIIDKGNGSLSFEKVEVEEAQKIKGMSAEEAMVYSHIQAAGRDAIWTKTITSRTNLHQQVVISCLKSLKSKGYIKEVKSVKNPSRKMYMQSTLQPSLEVTGGPWFTDSELDSEFVENLLNVIWSFVVRESFPDAFGNKKQELYPANYKGYPSVTDIHKFVEDSNVTKEVLGVHNIRSLCEVLVYDDRLERRDGGAAYRATWKSVLDAMGENDLDGFTESSCGRCPVFSLCEDGGPVNSECPYYDEWLTI